jgi:hypothetical protein
LGATGLAKSSVGIAQAVAGNQFTRREVNSLKHDLRHVPLEA